MTNSVTAKRSEPYQIFTQHEALKIVVGETSPLNEMTEIRVTRNGIDAHVFMRVAKKLNQPINVFAKNVGTTEKTVRRYKDEKKKLNSTVTQNTIELAKIYDEGVAYFKGNDRWSTWLDTPSVYFDGEAPLSVIDTQAGRALIRKILLKLAHGLTA